MAERDTMFAPADASDVPEESPAPAGPDRRLKVVCFLFDPAVGGPTIRARSVYQRMRAAGHDIVIAFPREEGPALDFVREVGVEGVRLPIAKPVHPSRVLQFLRYAAGIPLSAWRVRAFLASRKPDLVHVNGAFDLVPALGARLAGVGVVWHLNDTAAGRLSSLVLGRLTRLIADRIVVAADRVAQHYGIGEATILYAPVDVARFAPRKVDRLPGRVVRLGLIANWNWIKGHDRALELVRQLRERGQPVNLRIVGRFLESHKRYWQPLVQRIRELALEEIIETPGFSDDVPGEIAGWDIMILTSRSEACPMSVLEAMSVGVPQVAFDVGGVRELLGEGDEAAGIVVREGDVGAMADAVQRLASDPDLYHRMAVSGQQRARRLFSLEACVERHEAVYRSTLDAIV